MTSSKLLGVHIDECLTWSVHIDVLSKKLSQKIGILRRLRNFMSNAALLRICTVWSAAKNKTFIDRLFRLQKKAGRIILNVKQTQTSTVNILHTLKWMPVHDYFMYRKLILTFKVLNNLTPQYLNVFKLVSQISTRTTRQSISSTLLYIPNVRTEYYKRYFSIPSAILWNELPESVRNCSSLASFKSNYLQYYMNLWYNHFYCREQALTFYIV